MSREVPPLQPMLTPERSLLHERPCRLRQRMLSRPPSRDAFFDESIEFAERPPANAAEVVPGATDVRVQFLDECIEADPRTSRDPSQFVLGAELCLLGHVEKESPSPQEMLVAQEIEARFPNKLLHLGLLCVQ